MTAPAAPSFRLLGPVEVRVGGRLVEVGQPRQRGVLAALLADAGRVVTLEALVDRVWGERPPDGARHALYSHVARVRRALRQAGTAAWTAPRLERRTGGYLLDVDPDQVDLHRLRRLLEQARQPGCAGAGRVALLREALALWRGEPLAGLPGSWAARMREAWRQLRLDTLLAWAQAELEAANPGAVIGPLAELAGEYPVALLADALGLTDAERAAVAATVADPGGPGPAAATAAATGTATGAAPATLAPRQLPPDIEDFTGRDLALERVHARVDGRRRESTAVVITAAVGKAGVGKTTLAVHAAHQLLGAFPDGQLYVNLRGVEAQALDPADVLGGFLRALGVDAGAVPDDADERARLYRSLLAERRVLVLLDNAADEAQVRPLLPAGAANLVLVTSRARLAGLALAEVIDLDVLPPDEAVELLGKIAGAGRVAREPRAAAAIAALCGYLPLALRIVGARLAAKPHWRLQRLADRLGEQHRRLDELAAGDLEVRASLALSYQGLGEVERRGFRLLGLLEVPDFAPWMVSALLDVPASEAEDIAERLADAQLLDVLGEDAAGQVRYRFHDLLRLYARERLAAEDTPATRRAALERTLRAYFTTAQESLRSLRLRSPELPGQTVPAVPPDVAARLAWAYQWLAAEHKGLVASLDQAWRQGLGGLGQALTRLLADFFEVYASWDEWERTHKVALRAAQLAGDRHAEASLLRGLGDLRRFQRRLSDAVPFFTRSIALFRELGDPRGETDSLIGLARAYRRQGRLADAVACFEQGLERCRQLGDRDREAKAMLFFAKVRRQQGRYEDALALLAECGETFRSLGNVGYAGYSDLMLGITAYECGQYELASDHLQRALAFALLLGDPRWIAYAHLNLGAAAYARGSHGEARQQLEQALAMFEQVGDRHGAARTRQLLAALREHASAHS